MRTEKAEDGGKEEEDNKTEIGDNKAAGVDTLK